MHARIVTKRMADVRSRKSLEIVSQGSFVFRRNSMKYTTVQEQIQILRMQNFRIDNEDVNAVRYIGRTEEKAPTAINDVPCCV